MTYVTRVTTTNRTTAQRTRLIKYRIIEPPPWRKSLSDARGADPGVGSAPRRHAASGRTPLLEVDLVDGRGLDRAGIDARREELAVVPVVDRDRRRPRLLDLKIEVAVRGEALRSTQLRGTAHQLVRRRVVEV